MASKWQVHTDEYGNLYFSNNITGESVWELPEEEEDQTIQVQDDQVHEQLPKPKEQYSVYAVAVGVVEVVVKLIETIEDKSQSVKKPRKFMSPAAEKRFLKNAASDEKRKKRQRDRAVNTYLDLLIPRIEAGNASPGLETSSSKLREVGSLFTAEESKKWQREREQERDAKRKAVRRARRQHHERVESLQKHQHMLISFRSDLMKYLLGQILCSTELQKQRILLLTTPQMLAEIMERKREMQSKIEPELAEKLAADEKLARENYKENIRKVFRSIDETGRGKLHLLQILFGVFSKERPQQYASRVRGLAELLRSTELQRFLIEFVSQFTKQDPANLHLITASQFHEFVTIIEEVLDHYLGVKSAVEDAENDIHEILATASSSGVSVARARVGSVFAKKANHELAMIKEHETQLQALRDQEKRRVLGIRGDSRVAPKEEWEKNHHHRYIRLEDDLPLFCCLCRRRRWELWRKEHEECESEYRSQWPSLHALRLKDEQLRFTQERDKQNGIYDEVVTPAKESARVPDESSADCRTERYEIAAFRGHKDEDSIAVRQTLIMLVMLVEAAMNESSSMNGKAQRRVHKKKAKITSSKKTKGQPATVVQERMKLFENEELERKAVYTEELRMVIMLERNRRSIERPLLRVQDAAHDAYVRLIAHCVNLSGFLSRLDFERCLAFSPPQRMVLLVADKGVKLKPLATSNRLVLHTVPCRTEEMAEFIFAHAKSMQKSLRTPFVAEVQSVDKHMFQVFSESGLLVECWPVVIVVSEYFHYGSWLAYYHKHFLETSKDGIKYSVMEEHVCYVFREVACGLAAMHSLGLLHLNVNLGNIYVVNATNGGAQHDKIHVKISGLLSWKKDFDEGNLRVSDMHDCFDYNYAPPEATKELPITAKVDVWMLGCALCEVLFMWQHQQLILSTPNQAAQSRPPVIFHSKSINELLQGIPIATSASIRSLLRMLLQPNPAQRPQMNQVVDLLSLPAR